MVLTGKENEMKVLSRIYGKFLVASLGVLTACEPALPGEISAAYENLPETIDYNLHVKPILSDRCFACHGNDKNNRKAGLRLDVPGTDFGELPGFYHRILSEDPQEQMPPPESNLQLTPREKATLIRWIREGATYKPHWAFIKPEKPAVPKVEQTTTMHNPIDHFVSDKLAERGLSFSPEANKELLLRRLSLDLTGLPPTVAEIDAFLTDEGEDAYEKQVDRLLASMHYGEKMATDWMDVARFSDTYGYQVDRYRDMSPWRDWVIGAFNDNLPYDQFLTWQLAGDLLPDATKEQILATGFNRLHPQNMEDGIVPEEFRVENVADRVAVLGDGILGLTLSCAKCHDHKYDPISQKEYFQLFSFFDNINETGQISWDEATPVPNLQLPTPEQEDTLVWLTQRIDRAQQHLEEVSAAEKGEIEKWIRVGNYQQQLADPIPNKGLVAHYTLERTPIHNRVRPSQRAKMEREYSAKEVAHLAEGRNGQGLGLDGDAWLECDGVGIFRRSDAFSIGLWIKIPGELEEGVVFHKNKGSNLHSYRGYHLYLKNNRLEWVMARTWPENAIIEQTIDAVPRDEWMQLTVSYDGSSTAAGTRIYINGTEAKTSIEKDNLYKDIIFNNFEDIIYPEPIEPSLKIGARWRGKGMVGARVDDIVVYDRVLTLLEIQQIAGTGLEELLAARPTRLSTPQREQLATYYLANHSRAYDLALQSLHAAREQMVDAMENVQEIMVMKEMDPPRQTFVLNRGVYDDYGEEVVPGTPASLLPMPSDLPKNRLGLARWLTHPDHPLTARVAVNRYWQHYFGRGLVKTSQDFGFQGGLPSHPELLDWLSVYFVESGWDVKKLQKLIVTSATYRQSSLTDPELQAADPENIWLSRGPSNRLTSEMIRDNALVASDLLNGRVGGESVRPYQPDGLWAMNFDPYLQDRGDKLYRRSFYTLWRRTIPNPTLATFDQPNRDVCTVERQRTNTPLQALVLLNDPTFVEAARALGAQMAEIGNNRLSIESAYRKLTGKKPSEKELELLLQLREREYEVFRNNPQKANGWLEAGQYRVDPALDLNLVAANAVVASAIINTDAAITKR